jgi:DNA-binding PadR family transcriptional regulator
MPRPPANVQSPIAFQILLSLAAGESHGYAITAEIAARTDGRLRIQPGNLYRSLHQLLEAGLIAESSRRPAPDLSDARRRYYRITPAGRAQLKEEIAQLERVLRNAKLVQRRHLEDRK